MLKGNKAVLRPIKEDDLDHFLKWFNDQEVTRYLMHYLPMTGAYEKRWIEETCAKREPIFIIGVPDDDNRICTIGVCGLHKVNHRNGNAELGITIGEKDYWRRGFGFEALKLLIRYGFESLNLHKIYSGAYKKNTGSVNLHLKLGFIKEGERTEHVFANGEYHDLIEFGLLRKEWEKSKK